MGVNRYSTPTKYTEYVPRTIAEYASPMIAEARAKGAQMGLMASMDTQFDGFDSDKEAMAGDIQGIQDAKANTVEAIMNNREISGADLYDTVQKYNDLYGASGKVTKAKRAYKEYNTKKADLQKNAHLYMPGYVDATLAQSKAEYDKDPSAGIQFGNIYRKSNYQNKIFANIKTFLSNNQITTKALGEMYPGATEITGQDGKPMLSYTDADGVKVTKTMEQAKIDAQNVIAQQTVMNDPVIVAELQQYQQLGLIDDVQEHINNIATSAINVNNKNIVVDDTGKTNSTNGPKYNNGKVGGYGGQDSNMLTLTAKGTSIGSTGRKKQYNNLEEHGSEYMVHGDNVISEKEYDGKVAEIQKAVSAKDNKSLFELASKHGIKVEGKTKKEIGAELNQITTDMMVKGSRLEDEDQAIADEIKFNFLNSDAKAKESYEAFKKPASEYSMLDKYLDPKEILALDNLREDTELKGISVNSMFTKDDTLLWKLADEAGLTSETKIDENGFRYESNLERKEFIKQLKEKLDFNYNHKEKMETYFDENIENYSSEYSNPNAYNIKVQPGMSAKETTAAKSFMADSFSEVITINNGLASDEFSHNLPDGMAAKNLDVKKIANPRISVNGDLTGITLSGSYPDKDGVLQPMSMTVGEGHPAYTELMQNISNSGLGGELNSALAIRKTTGAEVPKQGRTYNLPQAPNVSYRQTESGLEVQYTRQTPDGVELVNLSPAYKGESAFSRAFKTPVPESVTRSMGLKQAISREDFIFQAINGKPTKDIPKIIEQLTITLQLTSEESLLLSAKINNPNVFDFNSEMEALSSNNDNFKAYLKTVDNANTFGVNQYVSLDGFYNKNASSLQSEKINTGGIDPDLIENTKTTSKSGVTTTKTTRRKRGTK